MAERGGLCGFGGSAERAFQSCEQVFDADRLGDQVRNHLAQAPGIALGPADLIRDPDFEGQTLARGQGLEDLTSPFDGLGDVEVELL